MHTFIVHTAFPTQHTGKNRIYSLFFISRQFFFVHVVFPRGEKFCYRHEKLAIRMQKLQEIRPVLKLS